MPRTPQSRIIPLVGSAALSTAVGMIPLHRLPRPVRTAYVVLPAAAGAGVVLAALRRTPSGSAQTRGEPGADREDSRRPDSRHRDAPRRDARRRITRAALPLLVGGLIAGAGAASIRVDRGIENALRRRDVPAPRLVMGLASGALSVGMDVLSSRAPAEGDMPSVER